MTPPIVVQNVSGRNRAHGLTRHAHSARDTPLRYQRGRTGLGDHRSFPGATLGFGALASHSASPATSDPLYRSSRNSNRPSRTVLKRRRVHTLVVDEQTSVESEKSLNALLEAEETVLRR